MSMVLKNNIPATLVLNTLNKNSSALSKSLKKVSGGERVTSAEDDASSWSISERMRVRIRALDQANQNAQNDNSLMQTAEGAINSTLDILRSLKEKAINAANDSNTDDDRKILQKEFDQFIDQIDDNALVTFNGKFLIDGTHNSQTRHMINSFANPSLGDNVRDPMTQWTTKTGESLNIQSTDKITMSSVWRGKTFSRTYDIGNKGMSDILAEWDADKIAADFISGVLWTTDTDFYGYDGQWKKISTPGEQKVEVVAPRPDTSRDYNVPNGNTGLDEQIGAFVLSVSDAQGNIRKEVNRFINDWHEVIHPQNESADNMLNFQVGSEANQAVKVGFSNMTAYGLALRGNDGTKLQITTQSAANTAVSAVDVAIERVLEEQTKIGAIRQRLEFTVSNLTVANENVQNAESVIRDADMAKEMTAYTKNNVLLQAAQSMLAQANQNSSAVLSLLQ